VLCGAEAYWAKAHKAHSKVKSKTVGEEKIVAIVRCGIDIKA
jgi:hypothetical protein